MYTVPGIFTLCTIFGRTPGFEPMLLRLQPGVLPISYTHPLFSPTAPSIFRLKKVVEMIAEVTTEITPNTWVSGLRIFLRIKGECIND